MQLLVNQTQTQNLVGLEVILNFTAVLQFDSATCYDFLLAPFVVSEPATGFAAPELDMIQMEGNHILIDPEAKKHGFGFKVKPKFNLTVFEKEIVVKGVSAGGTFYTATLKVERCPVSFKVDPNLLKFNHSLELGQPFTLTVPGRECEIEGAPFFSTQDIENSERTLASSGMVKKSTKHCSSVRFCNSLDIQPSAVGTLVFNLVESPTPITASQQVNAGPFRIQIRCPADVSSFISFGSPSNATLAHFTQNMAAPQSVELPTAIVAFSDCVSLNKFELDRVIPGLSLSCQGLSCRVIVGAEALQKPQTLKFKVVASDSKRAASKASHQLQIVIDPKPNLFAPEIASIEDVELMVNEAKVILIPQPTDLDGVTPLLETFSVDGFGSNFIKFDSLRREITISPSSKPENTGSFLVTLTVSDNQQPPKAMTTSFRVKINAIDQLPHTETISTQQKDAE